MYLNIVFLPLFSAVASGIFGRKLGFKGASLTAVTCLFFSFLFSVLAFYKLVLSSCPVYIKQAIWISSEVFHVDWGFMFDSLTLILCCIVTFISLVVHVYSIEYMHSDPHLPRFMSFLSLFTFFMLILITADNFIQMFFGWECVGICSYLLINFWHTRIQANKAAIKAVIVNRVGDLGLFLGIITIFTFFKTADYSTVFSLAPLFVNKNIIFLNCNCNLLNLIGIFLFVGVIGKSAQLFLHVWLPDAMEGPTPVSALIHAATMVTAGVFLLARCSPILEFAPFVLKIIAITGACTAFFGATVALFQNDIKKIIAYSTCSQLGYMVFASGLSNYYIAIFHLINHAFFKALLFLCAGSIIHAVYNEQDIRKMGGLRKLMPFTYSAMIIGSLSLSGFPFTSGCYSKDAILEIACSGYTNFAHFGYILSLVGAFLTAIYSTKILCLVFLSSPNGYKSVVCHAKEPSIIITLSLITLLIPSIFFGYCTKDMFVGNGTDFWGLSIHMSLNNFSKKVDAEFVNCFLKLLPVVLSLAGIGIAFFFITYKKKMLFKLKLTKKGKIVYNFLNKKWFFDKLNSEILNQFLFKIGYSINYKLIDKGIFEAVGPSGIIFASTKLANFLKRLETGYIYHYTLTILVGCTILLGLKQLWLISIFLIDYRLTYLFFLGGIILYHYSEIIHANSGSYEIDIVKKKSLFKKVNSSMVEQALDKGKVVSSNLI